MKIKSLVDTGDSAATAGASLAALGAAVFLAAGDALRVAFGLSAAGVSAFTAGAALALVSYV